MARLRRCTSVALAALMLGAGPLQGCSSWQSRPPVQTTLLAVGVGGLVILLAAGLAVATVFSGW